MKINTARYYGWFPQAIETQEVKDEEGNFIRFEEVTIDNPVTAFDYAKSYLDKILKDIVKRPAHDTFEAAKQEEKAQFDAKLDEGVSQIVSVDIQEIKDIV